MLDLVSRWKGILTILLVAGLGLAIHVTPMNQQSPCEPGIFAQVQAMVIPSAKAGDGCDDYCDLEFENCRDYYGTLCGPGCYDGEWTFCFRPNVE